MFIVSIFSMQARFSCLAAGHGSRMRILIHVVVAVLFPKVTIAAAQKIEGEFCICIWLWKFEIHVLKLPTS
jgi:hypothetical protein